MNTKQQLVELSANLLRSKGFDGFSYLDLARELGISKASVHHHFPKKQDLGLALCDWAHDWLIQGLNHFDAKANSDWNRLERYVQAGIKYTLTDQKMCPLSAFYSDLHKLSDPMRLSIKKIGQIEIDWIAGVIQSGQDSGEFVEQKDNYAMAALFVFSCKGSLISARLHGQDLLHTTMNQFEHILKIN